MATVPVEMTFSAGSVLTAAQLNTNVRDAVNFVIAPPLAVLRQTVAQIFTTGIGAAFLFDTEDLDRDGGHSTTTNTSRYVSQTAGWYQMQGTAMFAVSNTSTGLITGFSLNGASSRFGGNFQVGNAGFVGVLPSGATVYLSVGNYVELIGYQSSGGNLNSQVTGFEGTPRLQILWVSS